MLVAGTALGRDSLPLASTADPSGTQQGTRVVVMPTVTSWSRAPSGQMRTIGTVLAQWHFSNFSLLHLIFLSCCWSYSCSYPNTFQFLSSLNCCLCRWKTSREHFFHVSRQNVTQLLPVGTCAGASHLQLHPVQPGRLLGKGKEIEEAIQLEVGNCLQQSDRCLWFVSTFPKGQC